MHKISDSDPASGLFPSYTLVYPFLVYWPISCTLSTLGWETENVLYGPAVAATIGVRSPDKCYKNQPKRDEVRDIFGHLFHLLPGSFAPQ